MFSNAFFLRVSANSYTKQFYILMYTNKFYLILLPPMFLHFQIQISISSHLEIVMSAKLMLSILKNFISVIWLGVQAQIPGASFYK